MVLVLRELYDGDSVLIPTKSAVYSEAMSATCSD